MRVSVKPQRLGVGGFFLVGLRFSLCRRFRVLRSRGRAAALAEGGGQERGGLGGVDSVLGFGLLLAGGLLPGRFLPGDRLRRRFGALRFGCRCGGFRALGACRLRAGVRRAGRGRGLRGAVAQAELREQVGVNVAEFGGRFAACVGARIRVVVVNALAPATAAASAARSTQ